MRLLFLGALLALSPLAVQAQPITGADLDAMFDSEPTVEVNLRGSLIRLAAEAAREDSPEAALMLDGLRAITVRIYPALLADHDLAVSRFTTVGQRFERDGWLPLVRVRSRPGRATVEVEGEDIEDDADVWIYVRDDGDSFDGMAVLAIDGSDENAVFVFIDGTIDPTQVGELSRRFARVDIDEDEDDDE